MKNVDNIESFPKSPDVPFEGDREVLCAAIDSINQGLDLIGVSPIKKRKISKQRYSSEKIKNITGALTNKIFHSVIDDDNVSVEENDGDRILKVLKDEFHSTTERSKKIRILTLFKDWSYRKIQHHFPLATDHMIKIAKQIANEKGILSDATPKIRPTLDKKVIDLIINFYQLDENSRIMPGKKDFVSVKVDGKRIQMQKRLLLINLKELYELFQETHPEAKCSFSKFASLRPKHCVLAGASGTHSVCVCTIHENVKLMIEGSNMKNLTAHTPNPFTSYHDCLKYMICDEPTDDCYFGNCSECPGAQHLIDELEKIFEANYIDEITYRQWTHVDRTTLQVMLSPTDEYLPKLKISLEKLLLHSFLVIRQNEFMKSKKQELTENECIVVCDFSENYGFVVQNAAQGFHWNNNQATVHPFAIYHKDNNGNLQVKSLVMISECLHHDTIAVHVFQKHLVNFLNAELKQISEIIYFSDGSGAQYKNKKNFANLIYHEKDFGLAAEWHFFPTSHGKGACDGLGGTLKRLAARASLQRVSNPIQTPKQLFEWATESLPNIRIKYTTNEEYEEEERKLETRFKKAITVKGTRNLHCFIPIGMREMRVKQFSLQENNDSIAVKVMK